MQYVIHCDEERRRVEVLDFIRCARRTSFELQARREDRMEGLGLPRDYLAHGTRSLVRRHEAWSRCWREPASLSMCHMQRCLWSKIVKD